MLRDNEVRVDIGRAIDGGTFVRVVHIPTGRTRTKEGVGSEPPAAVVSRLRAELEAELSAAVSKPAWIRADSAKSILHRYPELKIMEELPEWVTSAGAPSLAEHDLEDPPAGLLADLIAQRRR